MSKCAFFPVGVRHGKCLYKLPILPCGTLNKKLLMEQHSFDTKICANILREANSFLRATFEGLCEPLGRDNVVCGQISLCFKGNKGCGIY